MVRLEWWHMPSQNGATRPIRTRDIKRPPQSLLASLAQIGSATATSELKRLGIRNAFIQGPVSMTPGVSIVGPALTLQFMPKREDLYPDAEYVEPEQQLHRHVLYHTKPGDIVVVDARGDLNSGVFGEMMMTYFRGRGGLGVVIDGAIRNPGRTEPSDKPDSMLDPDAIAASYWHVVQQPRSAWTWEVELRPWTERF